MRYHFTPIRLEEVKMSENAVLVIRCCLWKDKLVQVLWRVFWPYVVKLIFSLYC